MFPHWVLPWRTRETPSKDTDPFMEAHIQDLDQPPTKATHFCVLNWIWNAYVGSCI